MDEKNNKIKNSDRRYMRYLPLLFIAVFVIAGAVFLAEAFKRAEQQKKYEKLAGNNTYMEAVSDTEQDNESDDKSSGAKKLNDEPQRTDEAGETNAQILSAEEQNLLRLEEMGIPIPEKQVDFETLREQINADIYAWIYIPDTMIDYPLLQHQSDNTYYLKYNIDGSKGYPGCIYTENYNSKDFTDPVTVVYGHNMKNGSMFAGLHKFEDSEYFEEHPYVYIYTPDKLFVYEIFSACIYGDKHILLNHDFSDKVSFEHYLSEIEAVRDMGTNRRDDVEVTAEDHIIVLSTCVADKSDKRYLVQGVLLNEN